MSPLPKRCDGPKHQRKKPRDARAGGMHWFWRTVSDDVELKTFITGGYTQPVTSLPLIFITTSILLAKRSCTRSAAEAGLPARRDAVRGDGVSPDGVAGQGLGANGEGREEEKKAGEEGRRGGRVKKISTSGITSGQPGPWP
ncbi:hypothetical protein JOQ06_005550 [Pogonophryne albipinna]|uniref:Uncharacterized protein n=1 Tax=Pogonophryne albipinna TaxID=1090488 RepID=A0AAD6BJ16_9TELE|nr:hypothetical protein JOQ06_005550 [Pogonophryne albipinna]